jgi:hypothetical protein
VQWDRAWLTSSGGFKPHFLARSHRCKREIPTQGPYDEVRSKTRSTSVRQQRLRAAKRHGGNARCMSFVSGPACTDCQKGGSRSQQIKLTRLHMPHLNLRSSLDSLPSLIIHIQRLPLSLVLKRVGRGSFERSVRGNLLVRSRLSALRPR